MKILHRAKTLEGVWVEGYYFNDSTTARIIRLDGFVFYAVDPETVGVWTGLEDVNKKKIWEGDIVNLEEYDEGKCGFNCVVEWLDEYAMWYLNGRGDCANYPIGDIKDNHDITIIGNKWDNPELLQQ